MKRRAGALCESAGWATLKAVKRTVIGRCRQGRKTWSPLRCGLTKWSSAASVASPLQRRVRPSPT